MCNLLNTYSIRAYLLPEDKSETHRKSSKLTMYFNCSDTITLREIVLCALGANGARYHNRECSKRDKSTEEPICTNCAEKGQLDAVEDRNPTSTSRHKNTRNCRSNTKT
ncbi:hypothetical protein AVEN_60878-1 [Araneus ventricosus]|uniref:Uncharacterized protein n=1 Tax=Araneus ventricosus TaxID=182803 RepID=A0A4Y2NB86_ARAVE|nr:hypothetical protein AVEN_60878-1 [Araneus ventricosus]